MKQILQDIKSGKTFVQECSAPSISSNSIQIISKYSLISSGTERMLVEFGSSSYINKARKQPEKVKQVIDKISTDGIINTFDSVKTKLSEPIPLGYSNVGIVNDMADNVEGFKVGDRVVSNGPHSDVFNVNQNLCALVPDNVDDESAAFTVVASIALQGIRLAEPSMGENFVVYGTGLIGLIAIQLLKANGCNVLAVDFDEEKLSLAKNFGAEICNLSNGEDIEEFSKVFSNNKGVDGVIITASTDSNDVIKKSATISRKKGRIILVGVVGLNIDRSDFYEKELTFQVSCSYGPGRYDKNYEKKSIDYPFAYVRWTEQRNFEAILKLLSDGKLNFKPLITNEFNFDEFDKAYDHLKNSKESLGILLKYAQGNINLDKKIPTGILKTEFSKSKPVIGFIGSGNYSSRVLIPAFKRSRSQLHTIVSENGLSGSLNGKKFGFLYSSTDPKKLIADKNINTIIVATQHNTHSNFAVEALKNNKNVWIEKPLSLNIDELNDVKKAFEKNQSTDKPSQLMVGFNRRYAPHVLKMKKMLTPIKEPKSFIFTINAGFIPADHWTHDINYGGGRIIGEACHFFDLMQFLASSKINSVVAKKIGNISDISDDKASIILGFEDGSFGTINYLANGSSKFQKERIEVFTSGKILQLNNYKNLIGYGWSNFKKQSSFRQDKGQLDCVKAFLRSIEEGQSCIPFDQIYNSSFWTIKAAEMLRK